MGNKWRETKSHQDPNKRDLYQVLAKKSKCIPKEKGPGNQRQMQHPIRNSKTQPVGQKTQRNALQGQRATQTDATLRTSLQH